jgi:hypothetical protein
MRPVRAALAATLLASAWIVSLGLAPPPIPAPVPAPWIESMAEEGFPCAKPVAGQALVCTGNIDGYPNPVALLVPTAYRPTHSVDLILYFHGFNTAPVLTIPGLLKQFPIAASLDQSKRNAVLVFPLGKGTPPPEFSTLTDPTHPERFAQFMSAVEKVMVQTGLSETPDLGSLSVMSHSGGYRAVSNLTLQPAFDHALHSIYLLDSLYGDEKQFEDFCADPSHRFWSAYGPTFLSGFTGIPNRNVMTELTASKIDHVHFPVGAKPLGKNRMHLLTAAEAQANRIGFIQTDGDHLGTVKNFMSVFLQGGSGDDEAVGSR